MALKILAVSDEEYTPNQTDGGAESNVDELLKILTKDGIDARFSSTHNFNARMSELANFDLYIISNFYFLSQEAKDFLSSHKYIITEHDYKFLATRNPCQYKDFLVPKEQIINQEFYEKAAFVLVQSRLQKSIFERNLGLRNLINFSGNLWSEDVLDYIQSLSNLPKNGKVAILGEDACGIKGRDESILFCKQTFAKYDLIPRLGHKQFLRYLADYSSYVFFPRTPETLSRVCIEARLMNLSVITSQLTGVVHEPFYSLESADILQYLKGKRKEILDLVKSIL